MSTGESIGHLRAARDGIEHQRRAAASVIEGRASHVAHVTQGLELTIKELSHQISMSKSVVQYSQRERASISQADPEQDMERAGQAYELLGLARDRADKAAGLAEFLKGQVERLLQAWAGLNFSIVTEPIQDADAAAVEAADVLEELIAHLSQA